MRIPAGTITACVAAGESRQAARARSHRRDYLLTQLRGFIAGTRFDMDGNMSAAVQGLPDADAQLLADYLSALK